jgi:MFS transporter, DHA1 family, multidrug resistance protein
VMSHGALIGFTLVSAILAVLASFGPVSFAFFVSLFAAAMILFGLIGSNFTSIAMEPLGALAGTASSVQGFLQTMGGAVIGGLIGQAFDGTVFPISLSFALVGLASLICVLIAEKGKLFGSGLPAVH